MNFEELITEKHCGICECNFKGGREKHIMSRKHQKEIKECQEIYNKGRLIHSLIDSGNPIDINTIKGSIN